MTSPAWRREQYDLGRVVSHVGAGVAVHFRRTGGRYRYRFTCMVSDEAECPVYVETLRRIRDSVALKGLREHHDFRWWGVTEVGLRAKSQATMLLLELSGWRKG